MRKLLLVLGVATLLASPALADKDPDLGMEVVSPPAAADEAAVDGTAPAESVPVAPAGDVPETTLPGDAPAEAEMPLTIPPSGSVARSSFTSAVANREPTDELSELGNDRGRVLFFTELRGFAGQTVLHRWEWNGQVMAEIPFSIGGQRWRVYSVKALQPGWLGEWKVSVVDEAGNVVSTDEFQYKQASGDARAQPGSALASSEASDAAAPAAADEARLDEPAPEATAKPEDADSGEASDELDAKGAEDTDASDSGDAAGSESDTPER
jgi:hypothetical protein